LTTVIAAIITHQNIIATTNNYGYDCVNRSNKQHSNVYSATIRGDQCIHEHCIVSAIATQDEEPTIEGKGRGKERHGGTHGNIIIVKIILSTSWATCMRQNFVNASPD